MLRFGNAAALVLLVLLRRHAPGVVDELWQVERQLKGSEPGGCVGTPPTLCNLVRPSLLTPPIMPHPSHLRLTNMNVGTLLPGAVIPTSDDPSVDPAAYAARPCLSELLLLAVNTVLGFAPLVVPGEKAGLPIHHHVPVAAHACSGTSVSWRRPIAVHTEDLHASRLHGHFTLFGKMGNASARTPLWTVRSFLAVIPPSDLEWVLRAMALPYLLRPGAGRMDSAQERLVAPILAMHWDWRTVLRYNGADYASLRDGSRILRVDVLPAEWYQNDEQHELALRVLPLLRSLFADVDGVARSPSSSPLPSHTLATGDLLIVSNKAGPHCRTTFEGPRYVQRLYADYRCERLWDPKLNFDSVDERMGHLARCVNRDFDADQVSHLERNLAIPLAAILRASGEPAADDEWAMYAYNARRQPDHNLIEELALLEASIDDVAHLLMLEGPASPVLSRDLAASTELIAEMLRHLRGLYQELGELRRGGGAGLLQPHYLEVLRLQMHAGTCRDALRPLAFRLRENTKLLRVRAAVAKPGAIEAVKEAAKWTFSSLIDMLAITPVIRA